MGFLARPDDDRGDGLASYLFVDRVHDSEALRVSLLAHLERVRIDTITARDNENVLVFYGLGGMGKTRLSERLEHWLRGDLPSDDHWGPGPLTGVATVRWDLDHGDGALDLVGMLLALRAGLGRVGGRTPAFDLALAAYLCGVRPGETIDLLGGPDGTSVLGVIEAIAADLGASSLVASVSTMAIRRLVDTAVGTYRRHRELGRFAMLGPLLARCQVIPPGNPSPDLVIDLVWLLTEELGAMLPADRPPLVVFVDTFEKIQQPDAIKSEAVMNRILAHLPYALFVISGREKLNWHVPRDGLPKSGRKWWPSLVDGRDVEPRQHLLGRLSEHDRDELIRHRRASANWPISDAELAVAAARTDGYPLHLDAVCQMADNLTEDGATTLTADDLGKNLPDLVKRLLSGLSEEQARAFQAACLLPFFDPELAAAVAGISEGAVGQCIRRTLVEPHQSVHYPFKVHDEICALVRSAGDEVQVGWSDNDWRRAALRGLTEAERRHRHACEAHDDVATSEALVLGITIAVSYDLHADWLADAVRNAPTIRGLAVQLPKGPDGPTDSDALALLQLIHALDAPKSPASLVALREIFDGPTGIAEQGGRWLAYRLRALERRAEALSVFDELTRRFPKKQRLYDNQYSVTLRFMRRFEDCAHYRQEHQLEPVVPIAVQHLQGEDPRSLAHQLDRAGRQTSRRYGFEMETTAWSIEARHRPVPRAVVDAMIERAVILGAPAREVDGWVIRGYAALHHAEQFEVAYNHLERLSRTQSELPRAVLARMLALRGLAAGSSEHIERAIQEASGLQERSSSWVFAEFVLELAGTPLPSGPTQWLAPADMVRERWYGIINRLIERSAAGQILVG